MTNRKAFAAVAASACLVSVSIGTFGAGAATKTTKKAAAKTTKAPATTKAPTATAAPQTTTAGTTPTATTPAAPVSTPAAVTDADTNATINFGVLAAPRSLDPHKFFSVADFDWLYPMFDRLTIIDDSLQVKPMLASSWKFSADGKTLDLTLRRDAIFQDGSPIDAAAVKANLERGIKEKDSSVSASLNLINTIEVVDPYTVRLNLRVAGGALPVTLAGPPGMIVNPKAFGKDISNGPGEGMGSGPYRLTSYKSAEGGSFERANFKYWDPSAGLLKSFTLKFTGTSANALNGLKSGDYDYVQISGTDVVNAQADIQAKRIRGAEQLQLTTQNVFLLRSEKNTGAVGNKLIRQAIGYAINRNDIVGGLFNGNGRAATSYYPPDHWAYSARAAGFYTYNPQRAKSLIEQSGIAKPAIKITYSQGATVDAITVAIAQQLRDVGFEVTLDPRPAAQTAQVFQQGQTDILTASISGITNVDPANFISGFFVNNATSGTGVWSDPDGFFQKAIDAAGNPTLSLADKAKIYDPVFQRISEEGYMIPINNQLQLFARSNSKNIVDKAFYKWSGLPDFRSVYVQK